MKSEESNECEKLFKVEVIDKEFTVMIEASKRMRATLSVLA